MPTKNTINKETQICFADFGTDFSPAAANDLRQGTDTEVQITLASLANNAYRQAVKVSLLDANGDLPDECMISAAFEFAATPTAGNTVELWGSYSNSSTAANGNSGGASGADAAYTGYSSNADDAIKQCKLLGVFICTAQATTTVQIHKFCGSFRPLDSYLNLIVLNKSGAAFHSDDVESHIVIDPVVPEAQTT